MLSILTFSTLFPNSVQPRHGIFVKNRLDHLLADAPVQTRVVAPVPWFPFTHARFGRYAAFSKVPSRERLNGYDVFHPRYGVIPKWGMSLAPWLLASRSLPFCRALYNDKPFVLIDAHYFYPDGVAAVIVGQKMNLPVVVTARGTDVNVFPDFRVPRRWITWASARAAAIITVASALKEKLVALGTSPEKITVLRNGVDLNAFRPLDKAQARQQLDLNGRTLLSVGHLVENKGHHLIIDALVHLPDVELLIVGEGEMGESLRARARRNGVQDRVRFAGYVPHDQLIDYYNAADALVLASEMEGWANVLLEAMACGTPVIATAAGGTPEVVQDAAAGVLCRRRSADSIVEAANLLFDHYPGRDDTRRYAERFSWQATSAGQMAVFQNLLEGAPR